MITQTKNKQVYVSGQYLPGEQVPLSADEIARGKMFNRLFWLLAIILGVAVNGLLDRFGPTANATGFGWSTPLWLLILIAAASACGIYFAIRFRDMTDSMQEQIDRYQGRYGPND